MKMGSLTFILLCAVVCILQPHALGQSPADPRPATQTTPAPQVTLRVATFNIQDVRTEDLKDGSHPRLKRIAEIIQRIRPNVILINEIAYDMPGAPGFVQGQKPGQNGQRFCDLYLAVPQAEGLSPLRMKAYMPPTNTGVPSGHDLNNDGKTVKAFPPPPPGGADGSPGPQTQAGRDYGNDCWGFGTFPGQYGMALLVDARLTINESGVRTFQRYPWDYLPGHFMPVKEDGSDWYGPAVKEVRRLSSKTHADVPVVLPNGRTLHVLISHPTPPAFDGPEERNKRRNHDEIRFWADYIDNGAHIVDDASREGGLRFDAFFVILGDLNADPDEGSAFKNPIKNLLGASRRLNMQVTPVSDVALEGLDPDDTAMFKLRVDYVIPSRGLVVGKSGVWRLPAAEKFPSDHFPVWMDLTVPGEVVVSPR